MKKNKKTKKVFIENLPKPDNFFTKYIPIATALIAIVISIISILSIKEQFKISSRPYVWAIDAAKEGSNKMRIHLPHMIRLKVSNSPAKINYIKYYFYYEIKNKEFEIWTDNVPSYILFPDEKSEFDYTLADFNKKLSKVPNDSNLQRNIEIQYQDLDEKSTYKYFLKSEFITNKNKWEKIQETSN